ncbi:hypothetical protein [Haladaptatus sp. GCM10025893]|uniref:hypothetical protein n=1 Tax=Haladaptatus sp. GCM10025893 TaxID=3252659 RepID=UPI00361837C5
MFYESGTRTAAFSVTERRIEPENGRFGLALNLWHREDTHLDSLRYELRAPSNPNGPQVAVWLERPGASPWPEMTFGKGRDLHTTIIDVPEVGSVGVGSLGIELRLEATEMPDTLPARLDLSFDLSHEDRLFETYTAESSLEFDLHRNPNAQS